MRVPPIPQRIPPLRWRRPAFLWTPLALALAVGWPAALFYDEVAPQRLSVVALLIVFSLALASLGASWIVGRAPKARRTIVQHVVVTGAVTALASPLFSGVILHLGAETNLSVASRADVALALIPLALVLILPLALVSGIVFAWIALVRPSDETRRADVLNDEVFRAEVQPFR